MRQSMQHLLLVIVMISLSSLSLAQSTTMIKEPEQPADSASSAADIDLFNTATIELTTDPIHLRGRIIGFEFSQPASRIMLESDFQIWQIDAPSAIELRRLGWTGNSVFIGEQVEVELMPQLGVGNQGNLKRLTRANGALLLASLSEPQQAPGFVAIPQGAYVLDKQHAHLQFVFDHMGFSKNSVKFERINADVVWNTDQPYSSTVSLDIDVSSLRSGVNALDEGLRSDTFFDFLNHPKIQFRSSQLALLKWGDLQINGQLEIKGISRPVQLQATLNKVGRNPLTQAMTVGISVRGTLARSEWGLDAYIPTVADHIELMFDAEFIASNPASMPAMLLSPTESADDWFNPQPTTSDSYLDLTEPDTASDSDSL